MSFQYPARVKQSTTTTGTGPLTLLSPAGQQRSFQAHFGSGPVKLVYVIAGQGYFEYGYGTFTAPSTLTRDTVIVSSNSGALVSLPTATADVFADWPGDSWGLDTHSGNYLLTLADRGNIEEFTATATMTLPALSTVPPTGFAAMVNANGSGAVTIDAGSDNIMGGSTLDVPAGEAGFLFRNATEWRFFFYSNVPPPSASPIILDTGNVQTGGATILTLDLSGYSAYKRIEIDLENVKASSSGGSAMGIQFATDGGGFTWITSGYTDTHGGSHAEIQTATGFASTPFIIDSTINLFGINQSRPPNAMINTIYATIAAGTAVNAQEGGSLPGTTNANAVNIFLYSGSSLDVLQGNYRVIGYP